MRIVNMKNMVVKSIKKSPEFSGDFFFELKLNIINFQNFK